MRKEHYAYVTLEKFKAWVETKHPDNHYQVNNTCKCPMAQYAQDMHGFTKPDAGVYTVLDIATETYLPFESGILGSICGTKNKTYGELVEELQRYINFRSRRIKTKDDRNSPGLPAEAPSVA